MTVLDARQTNSFAGGPSFSLANRLTRLAWAVCWLALARWTPRQANGWRCLLARAFGAKVARGASIYPSVRLWLPSNLEIGAGSTLGAGVNVYSMAPIVIGRNVVISQGAYLCAGTHDHRDPHFQLVARPIAIGDRAWIASEAFVGPGVAVGEGAVLGARACAFKALEPWMVYLGNPAQPIARRELRVD